MKIRIKGNSIRIRVTKTEINNFGQYGILEDVTDFGNSKLRYSIQSSNSCTELKATFDNNCITVWIPENIKKEWISTDVVGFQNDYKTDVDKKLFILIEKDFVCLDNTFEDQSDNFPNPNAVC